jgi:hypothetical protein
VQANSFGLTITVYLETMKIFIIFDPAVEKFSVKDSHQQDIVGGHPSNSSFSPTSS